MTYIQNWPLMWRVLRHVVDHPDEYDQTRWWSHTPCGTTRCVAGWLAHLAKYSDFPGDSWHVVRPGLVVPVGDDEALDALYDDGAVSVDEAALDALGVEDWSRRNLVDISLFSGTLSWNDVLQNVVAFAEADGVTPPLRVLDILTDEGVLPSDHPWRQ